MAIMENERQDGAVWLLHPSLPSNLNRLESDGALLSVGVHVLPFVAVLANGERAALFAREERIFLTTSPPTYGQLLPVPEEKARNLQV